MLDPRLAREAAASLVGCSVADVLLLRYDTGERSALYPELRALTDELICQMEEEPERTKSSIDRLVDRCEALLRSLAN